MKYLVIFLFSVALVFSALSGCNKRLPPPQTSPGGNIVYGYWALTRTDTAYMLEDSIQRLFGRIYRAEIQAEKSSAKIRRETIVNPRDGRYEVLRIIDY